MEDSSTTVADSAKVKGLGANVWKAEKIVGERSDIFRGIEVTEFLIKWEGYDDDQNTWEPKKHIFDKSLIDDWRAEHPAVPLPKKPKLADVINATEGRKKGKMIVKKVKKPFKKMEADSSAAPDVVKAKKRKPSNLIPEKKKAGTVTVVPAPVPVFSGEPAVRVSKIPKIIGFSKIEATGGVTVQIVELDPKNAA